MDQIDAIIERIMKAERAKRYNFRVDQFYSYFRVPDRDKPPYLLYDDLNEDEFIDPTTNDYLSNSMLNDFTTSQKDDKYHNLSYDPETSNTTKHSSFFEIPSLNLKQEIVTDPRDCILNTVDGFYCSKILNESKVTTTFDSRVYFFYELCREFFYFNGTILQRHDPQEPKLTNSIHFIEHTLGALRDHLFYLRLKPNDPRKNTLSSHLRTYKVDYPLMYYLIVNDMHWRNLLFSSRLRKAFPFIIPPRLTSRSLLELINLSLFLIEPDRTNYPVIDSIINWKSPDAISNFLYEYPDVNVPSLRLLDWIRTMSLEFDLPNPHPLLKELIRCANSSKIHLQDWTNFNVSDFDVFCNGKKLRTFTYLLRSRHYFNKIDDFYAPLRQWKIHVIDKSKHRRKVFDDDFFDVNEINDINNLDTSSVDWLYGESY